MNLKKILDKWVVPMWTWQKVMKLMSERLKFGEHCFVWVISFCGLYEKEGLEAKRQERKLGQGFRFRGQCSSLG